MQQATGLARLDSKLLSRRQALRGTLYSEALPLEREYMEALSESERFSRILSIVHTGDMIEPGVFIVDDLEYERQT